jgi:hypothetical protein
MAKIYFSPKRLFMNREMAAYGETPQGKIATTKEKQVQLKY